MRRTLLLLTASPLVILLTIVQAGSILAAANPNAMMVPTAPASSFPPVHMDQTLSLHRLQPALQITTTAPVPELAAPALGPSTTSTITEPSLLIDSETITEAVELSPEATVLTPTLTTVQLLTDTQESVVDAAATLNESDAAYALPIEGTIVANRTGAEIRFFVEGATYELTAQRSVGLNLPRVTAVLNLYNCDANTPETTDGCFWDPYLLDRDGFYEIVAGDNASTNLTLQPAGSPPLNQIWIQNRTGKRETFFYQGEEIELPPAAVREFASAADVPAIFYLRSCLALTDRTVCEWAPADAEPGFYYALEENTIVSNLPNSEIIAIELRPILSKDGDPVEQPVQVACQLQVPTLNVRSGPGLEYQIIAKIRGTDQEPGRMTAIGRNDLSEWLAVNERIAPGGWVVASPSFIQCNGDINALPIAEISDGRLAPTPEPIVAAPSVDAAAQGTDNDGAADGDTTGDNSNAEEATPEPAVAAPLSLAEGQALLVINNGFDQQVRFTLDQRFRIEQGLSEYDLNPGESVSILVFPGQIAFSASSPWRGLSGNAEFFLDNKETRTLWLYFVPDPDGSGRWILQF